MSNLPVEEETILCPHIAFTSEANTYRLTDDNGVLSDFIFELRVSCAHCGVPFRFVGLDDGISYTKPFQSEGGNVLNAPMQVGAPVSRETLPT